jgi:hypothetical protein
MYMIIYYICSDASDSSLGILRGRSRTYRKRRRSEACGKTTGMLDIHPKYFFLQSPSSFIFN